jgi:methionyl-tRNA synthetase
MGKDNVSFHSVMFPACLLGTREPYTTVSYISATEYLLFEGKKFSKSNGVGVFCDSLIETGIDPSLWRYYLISIRPEASDSNFTWDEFAHTINSQLLANLGNLFNRILGLNYSKYREVPFNKPSPN